MRGLFLALPLLLAAEPALAAPTFLPTRDVSVTYELDAPGRAPADYQLNFDAENWRARVETTTQGIYVLANLRAGQAQVVIPALHAIVEAPDFSNLTQLIANADNSRFTPLGHGHYAGMRCEKYLVLNDHGSGEACITRDGVVLHFTGKDERGSAAVTAVSVHYGSLPPEEFVPPDGFSAINLPPGALAALLQSGQ